MSKGFSGLFRNTIGINELMISYSVQQSEPSNYDVLTSNIWNEIFSTQENYKDTILPKSFVINVPITDTTLDGKIWTNGNATEHMYELITSKSKNAPFIINSNPNLYTQFILYDYHQCLNNIIRKGFTYDELLQEGNWEIIISRPRSGKPYPVVKHAILTKLLF